MTAESGLTGLLIPWGEQLLSFQPVSWHRYRAANGIELSIGDAAARAFWPEVGLGASARDACAAVHSLREAALQRRAVLDAELNSSKTVTQHLELSGCPQCPWYRYGHCSHPDAEETRRPPWETCPIRRRAVLITAQ